MTIHINTTEIMTSFNKKWWQRAADRWTGGQVTWDGALSDDHLAGQNQTGQLLHLWTHNNTTTQQHTVIDHTSQTRHRFILSSKIRELKYEAENLNFIQVCSDWTLMLILLFWEVLDVNSDAARGRHGTALRRIPPRGGHTGIWSELHTKFKTRNEK